MVVIIVKAIEKREKNQQFLNLCYVLGIMLGRLLANLNFICLFFWLLCELNGVILILQMRKQIN